MTHYSGYITKCNWIAGGAWLVEVYENYGDDAERSAATSKAAAKRHALELVRQMSGSDRKRVSWDDISAGSACFHVQIKDDS